MPKTRVVLAQKRGGANFKTGWHAAVPPLRMAFPPVPKGVSINPETPISLDIVSDKPVKEHPASEEPASLSLMQIAGLRPTR